MGAQGGPVLAVLCRSKERAPFTRDGKSVSKMKLFNLRDGISEVILDKFYEDPTLVSYGEKPA